ncbi:MAG: hypothetical protein OXG35_22780 [Acidobacteria bacterium]|nr:hypothetical protein [Acidobacteriota bacterium]
MTSGTDNEDSAARKSETRRADRNLLDPRDTAPAERSPFDPRAAFLPGALTEAEIQSGENQ